MKQIYKILCILSIFLIMMGTVGAKTQEEERKAIEENQKRLMASTPLPQLTDSLERENIAKRLQLTNTRDKLFYVYLIDHGKVMAFFTSGKISSVSSYLVTQEQIVDDPHAYGENSQGMVVEAPDLDGSYGTNGDGIFFWTTDGKYVEWKGTYMVSDYPYSLVTPPEIFMQV